jgi:predicted GIY-YIG superfamily endonuclease
MAFYTYVLRCSDNSYYTGHTDNIEARFYAHQNGVLKCYTTTRRPVKLIWCEMFETREEALSSERMIKGWSRAKKEALVAGDWTEVIRLARAYRPHVQRKSTATHSDGALVHPSRASG